MKEASARIKINKLLEVAGWRFFADASGPANIQLEPGVTLVTQSLDARELLTKLLELAGATVTSAGSAEEAMKCLPLARPSVLICDIGMPGEDGYSFIERLRVLDPNIPALALTAYARAED